jgi:ectoine hydroxylase-related dioxygenase (phytanoyl-CoA dioxygenase family)
MNTSHFAENGYATIPCGISDDECDDLTRQVARLQLAGAGSRNLLLQPWCMNLAAALRTHAALAPLLPADAAAVQCTLFEKTAHKNWAVAIHQDLSIPVRERTHAPECTGWARKEGVMYTQSPPGVLADIVAVRVHLDPCPAHAGPLRVVPGSHRYGRLAESEFDRLRTQHGEVECTADRGEAFVMRPLLLHSSSRVTSVSNRRVLHFVFGPRNLPSGLNWHMAV